MMYDYSAQIGAEYDKSAPFCPGCGRKMTFLTRLGGKIVWDCACGEQQNESLARFRDRTSKSNERRPT